MVLFFAMHQLDGQSIPKDSFQQKVSVKGQDLSFEEVLNQLSEQTRLYFIYSSNTIELNKSLSFSLYQRPLHEVLGELGEMMHLTFRREGKYVVVKAANEIKAVDQHEKSFLDRQLQPEAKATPPMTVNVVDKKYSEIDNRLFIPDDLLKKTLLTCPAEFTGVDTSQLKKYFPLKITTPRPRRQLYTSVGLLTNEYSGGLEIRIGMPSLYAVANAGVMREGYLRYGYGVGTSIPIKTGVSLNSIYTFGTAARQQDYVLDENINLIVTEGLKFKAKHHQMKFLFHVQLSKRFALQVGPTINLLKASYTYDKNPILFTEVINSYVPSANYYYASSQVRITRSVYYLPPPDYSTLKSWVGFEGGVSYSIKFSRR
jgi:hypothetical protein